MAIRIWVQNQLIKLKGDTFNEKCQELKIRLYDSLPVYYGLVCLQTPILIASPKKIKFHSPALYTM